MIDQWGWSEQKTGKISPDEKAAIVAYCKAHNELPPLHKNVRRHWLEQATKRGWIVAPEEKEEVSA